MMLRSSGITLAVLVAAAGVLHSKAAPFPFHRPLPFAGNGTCEDPQTKDGLTSVRCLGPEVTLLPGQTLDTYMAFESPYPDRWVAVLRQDAQMVEKTGPNSWRPAPLSELYLHHVVPNPKFLLGVGAEIRGSKTKKVLPKPFVNAVNGIDAAKLESRMTNLQLVNTIGTPQKYLQESFECWCGQTGANATKGSLRCCKQNPTESLAGPSIYQIEFNVTFRDLTDEDIPVDMLGYDVTDGKVEYNIPENQGPNTTHVKAVETAWDATCRHKNSTGRVVRCTAHQHIGSTCSHAYNAETNELICSSCSVYGKKKGEAGNELGYVVAIKDDDLEKPYELKPGTKIRVETHYDASNKRLGVMGILVFVMADVGGCNKFASYPMYQMQWSEQAQITDFQAS